MPVNGVLLGVQHFSQSGCKSLSALLVSTLMRAGAESQPEKAGLQSRNDMLINKLLIRECAAGWRIEESQTGFCPEIDPLQ